MSDETREFIVGDKKIRWTFTEMTDRLQLQGSPGDYRSALRTWEAARPNKSTIYCLGKDCNHVFKEGDRAFEVTVGEILKDEELGEFFDSSETTYHLCEKCMNE